MNLFPLCTAMVWPTKSGEMVEARDHVLMTRFSPREFIMSSLDMRRSSMNGPFFTLRGMIRCSYCVALPRLRPRTMSLFEAFFRLRVFTPSRLPHGDTGGRPPDDLPSPPPRG